MTVTLTGVGAPQTTVTDGQGRFRFLNLSPGTYSLKAEGAGYGAATRAGVRVNIGRNAEIAMMLSPSVSQTISVTAEAPLLDVRRTGTGATVSEVELEEVPTARDPWVILQQVPGVLMDRINVGGNESGQQSQFVSKGATGDQATFSVDGVNTTDMIATGGSSAYFNFGSFEEVQITTGSTDPRVQTPGAQVNIVTKRGTNDFSGSGRYYLTDGGTQGERKIPAEGTLARPDLGLPNGYIGKTNEIDRVTEWGLEMGGPIIRDRLWIWGAYSNNDTDLFTTQAPDQHTPPRPQLRYSDVTAIENLDAKLNAQLTRNNSLTMTYARNEKVKIGRNAGPLFPPETTWNQSGFGPKGTYKIEDTQIVNANFYLTGLYSKVNGGFQLQPNSGANCMDLACVLANTPKAATFSVHDGYFRNTFVSVQSERPQEQYRADASSFFNTGSLSHELKFGFGYRTAGAEGLTTYPQNQVIYDYTDAFAGLPPGFGVTYFYAISPYNYEYKYNDLYVGDTMLWGNLTIQAGLRWDRQGGEARDQRSPANPVVNDLASHIDYLPALTWKGSDIDTIEWTSISPRIGVTYALGADKKTLLRAAYNRYVGQLGSNSSDYTGVIPGYRYIVFYTLDGNRNDKIEPGEVLFDYGIYKAVGFDPEHPASLDIPYRVDPNMAPPTTDEFILGFEREVLTDLLLTANFTHRKMDNFLWRRPEKHRGRGDWYTSADYEIGETITIPTIPPSLAGQITPIPIASYSIPVYRLKAGIPAPAFYALTNRDGYTQTYDGLELGIVKRLSNRWMLRGNFSWNDWKQQVSDEAIIDPTPIRTGFGCMTCDGAQVVQGSGTQSGSKGAVWINSKWAINAAGVYQIPFIETNLGANFTMRQGYPVLYVHQANGSPYQGGSEGAKQVLLTDIGDARLPNPYSLDLRLAKDFRFSGMGLEVAVDMFNATNRQTVLQRNASTANGVRVTGSRNFIREIQNPRVLRLGARVTF